MGGQVSLLCIRWDFQCLDFGLSPSKHCRKVKAIFKAAAQLHTSVTQTDDSWPLIWSVELKYGIWAACLVDVSPLFSVKSFYHFSVFGGFPSENMPFFHPFCTHLFSLLSLQRWRRSGTGGHRTRPLSLPWQRAQHIPTFPDCCCSAQKRTQILLVLIRWTSKLPTVWALGLFCLGIHSI